MLAETLPACFSTSRNLGTADGQNTLANQTLLVWSGKEQDIISVQQLQSLAANAVQPSLARVKPDKPCRGVLIPRILQPA